MEPRRSFLFASLPAATQARLKASIRGEGEPKPLFRLGPGDKMMLLVWVLLAAGSGLVGLLTLENGFGNVRAGGGPIGLVGGSLVALALGGLCVSVVGLFNAARLAGRRPIEGGVYVFARDVLVARSEELVLHPIESLQDVEVTHHHIGVGPASEYQSSTMYLVFPGGEKVVISLRGEALVASIVAALDAAKQISAASRAPENDVFFEARQAVMWSTASAVTPLHPPLSRLVVGSVISLTLSLTPFVVQAVNRASDDAKYAWVVDHPTVQACGAYLAHGELHLDEVRFGLLPAAELKEAKALRSPEKLEVFAREHPDSPRVAEALSLAAKLRAERVAREAQIKQDGGIVSPMDAALKLADSVAHLRVEPAVEPAPATPKR